MPVEMIEEIQKLSNENEVSFDKCIVQWCKYALEYIEKE